MPLTDANGRPIGNSLKQPQPQPVQCMGFAVFKKTLKGMLPFVTDKGDFAIMMNAEQAVHVANQLAQAELTPNKDQKVVTPQMKSSEYYIVALQVIGMAQATIKNPEQLLAPKGKLDA